MRSHRSLFLSIILGLGVLFLSTSAIFVKLANAPAPVVAFYRMFFSTILVLPMLLFEKDVNSKVKQMTKQQWGLSILSGIFLGLHFYLWFFSLHFTSVASSTVLVTLQPLFAFIGGYYFFKERITIRAILGGLLAMTGSIIIGLGDFKVGGQAFFGDVLAILGAMSVTVYFMIGQYVRKEMPVSLYTTIVYFSSSLFLLGTCLVHKNALIPYEKQQWLWFICLAIFPTLLGQTVFNYLLKWFRASTISMTILGEPVGTCLLAYVILHETITVQQSIGASIIIIGLFVFLTQGKKQEKGIS